MIVLKITNASEVVSSKLGKLLGNLVPESVDQATVEAILVSKLIENLAAEGLQGEVAAVSGLDLQQSGLVLDSESHIRTHRTI